MFKHKKLDNISKKYYCELKIQDFVLQKDQSVEYMEFLKELF